MGSDLVLGLGLGLTSILAAAGGLLLLLAFQSNRPKGHNSIFEDRARGTLFLFDGETLVDCTPGGRAALAASPAQGGMWVRLLAYLSPMFPEIDHHLARLREQGIVTLEGQDSEGMPMLLRAEYRGGLTRISLSDALETGGPGPDAMAHRAMTEELASLRAMLSHAPIMAWRERPDGEVIWANTDYVMAAAERLEPGQEMSWPLPRLFERIATAQGVAGQRQKLLRHDGTPHWYELTVAADDSGRRVYALPCDAAVQAEANLRDFLQTLAKTFAHLTTGLAVFDKNRKLQLFNPALLDLTGLAPDFLSARPTVVTMLDAMREKNMVPEPKDYRRWRQSLVEMEGADDQGVYEETWPLAGGQTYRVVGRRHGNGSMALMFEDISGEVSRTRRYRADLELGQAAIDAMDEGLAVFSETGQLVMSNRAYTALWGSDPMDRVAEAGIRGVSDFWAAQTAPSKLWAEMRDFIGTLGDREAWSAEARLLDGRRLICRLAPLTGGGTLVGFRTATDLREAQDPATALHRHMA